MNIEEQNFSHLIKRHKTTIYSVCLMFASCQDEANDLMQEVLIKLWNGRSSFKEHCDETRMGMESGHEHMHHSRQATQAKKKDTGACRP